MIEWIKITGFQCHRDLHLDLRSDITTITGDSDVGKSAVFRALKWVCLGKPRGESFVTKGSKRCEVEVKVDGHTIKRVRDRSNNEYYVDGEKLVGFGTDVPRQVREILQVTDDNFQGQHDLPFWVSLPPSELAKQLNSLIDLTLADKVQSKLRSLSREYSTQYKLVKERCESLEQQLQSLQYVCEMEEDFEGVTCLSDEVKELQRVLFEFRGLVSEITTLQLRIRELQQLSDDFLQIQELGDKICEVEEEIQNLGKVIQEVGGLSWVQQVDLQSLVTDMQRVEEDAKILERKRVDISDLTELVDAISVLQGQVGEWKNRYDLLVQEVKRKWEDRCPVCGGKWDATSCSDFVF